MGIVFVPIPASIVKIIEGIEIKQTSLFFNIGDTLLLSRAHISTPRSKTNHSEISTIYHFFQQQYYYSKQYIQQYQPVFKNQNSESLNKVLFHKFPTFCSSNLVSSSIFSFFSIKLWLIRFNISMLA